VPFTEGGRACEWAIELRAEGRVIGGTSLERIDPFHGTAGGGIWLNSRYLGQGYGTEAFGERNRFAFENLGLRRLDNGFFVGNDASRRMQERLGYRIEGTKRQALRCMADGDIKDETITGLLREDWVRHEKRL
jgi:RimJ/RimL family protein N-acetyltransferase